MVSSFKDEMQIVDLAVYAKHLCKRSKLLFLLYDKKDINPEYKDIIAELCNLYFFKSLSITHTLLYGSNKEYRLDPSKTQHLRGEYSQSDLPDLRNIIGDHKGKRQLTSKKKEFDPGDYVNHMTNRIKLKYVSSLNGYLDQILIIAKSNPNTISDGPKWILSKSDENFKILLNSMKK